MIVQIPLDRIQGNPWQTREGEPDPAYVKELALDIAQNGLMQTPVGRLVNVHPGMAHSEPVFVMASDPAVMAQLAFGHNRLAAFRWLYDLRDHSNIDGDFSSMPVEIRALSDEQMAIMAWSENEKRRDVTPIERARALQRRIDDFRWTQAQAAEHLGLNRATVSNVLRLLRLPEDVAGALADGRISERVAMALVSLFDLPEALRAKAGSESWSEVNPNTIVREALSGELTSDKVRERVKRLCDRFGVDLARASWELDEMVAGQGLRALICRECPMRLAERNLCMDRDCYQLKEQFYKTAYLKAAAEISGIELLEFEKYSSYLHTDISGNHSERQKGFAEKIIAGKCQNLRIRYTEAVTGPTRLAGFDHAEIVCCKKEQFCTCLAGLRATKERRDVIWTESNASEISGVKSYDIKQEAFTEAPAVEVPEQATADELKAAAQAARRERKALEQEKALILRQAAEAITLALRSQNIRAWSWLAAKVSYLLKGPFESTFDAQAAIVLNELPSLEYTETLAGVMRKVNGVLQACDVDPFPGWDMNEHAPAVPVADVPASEDAPAGKSLIEIFAEEQE